MRADTQALLEGDLGQWLGENSELKDKARRRAIFILVVGGLLYAGLGLALWFLSDMHIDDKIGFYALFPCAVGFAAFWQIHRARTTVKTSVNDAIAARLGLTFAKKAEPGEERGYAVKYGLFPYFTHTSFVDLWHGTVDGREFKLYEAILSRSRGGMAFNGAVMFADVKRPFSSTTLIQRAGANDSWLGLGDRKDTIKCVDHTLHHVSGLGREFEARFEVWSDDEAETRSLLTPDIVERLLKFEEGFDNGRMRLLLHEGKLLATVRMRRLFESGFYKEGEQTQSIEDTATQVGLFLELAATFDRPAPA